MITIQQQIKYLDSNKDKIYQYDEMTIIIIMKVNLKVIQRQLGQ